MGLEFLAGAGWGSVVGMLVCYVVTTRPLIAAITRLRYDGFRPEAAPIPQRPKTVPLPPVNER